ncbi:FAD-dependent oxidoreductase [Amycolatopsis thermoflava]|uniref:FAD-dependent oxidoreductase n=1 Tax=Amycolatopsis thermoflava TaxID=84480 RepID=UPI003661E0FD
MTGSVRLVVDTATRIDVGERRVTPASGGMAGYDYLIYAFGSGSARPGVPGGADFAYSAATSEEVQRLRPVLEAAPATAPVTLAGAGMLGIEIAVEQAEAGRPVTLVSGGVLGPYLHPRVRRSVARPARIGVSVLDGPGATVTAARRYAVTLGDGRELPRAVTIWTTVFGVPDLATRSGLSADATGRLLTDETLTSVDDERVIAAGDLAAPSSVPLRMSCQAANPLGAHAADTVLARIAGDRPALIEVGFFGLCVSLGQRTGTVQLAAKDDTANRFSTGGRLSGKVKESSYTGLLEHLAYEARTPGWYSWKFKDFRRRQRLRTEDGAAHAPR